MDPSEYNGGSGIVELSAAVKNSGKYDPWVVQPVEEVKDGLETVQEKKVKVFFSSDHGYISWLIARPFLTLPAPRFK